jgi:hypothetical protein
MKESFRSRSLALLSSYSRATVVCIFTEWRVNNVHNSLSESVKNKIKNHQNPSISREIINRTDLVIKRLPLKVSKYTTGARGVANNIMFGNMVAKLWCYKIHGSYT